MQPALDKNTRHSLLSVDRAVAELRRGGMVIVTGASETLAVMAAEGLVERDLDRLKTQSGTRPGLIITERRATALNLEPGPCAVVALCAGKDLDAKTITALTDPCADRPAALPAAMTAQGLDAKNVQFAAVLLTKLARLLPAAVTVPLGEMNTEGLLHVNDADIRAYDETAARSLSQVGEARVPLQGAEDARVLSFRPEDGGQEHLAILIGEPTADQPVLIRLHSECFTGDLLGSLRCDCGDQLRGAIEEISKAGSGVLLYLPQEGRGIGLVNKLRAYQLQDRGFDTLDANGQLGFDDDERIYLPAAQMLKQLGYSRVRLMTNNPMKVEQLARHGIDVTERVPHVFPSNGHNSAYLHTKATKGGHLFKPESDS